MLHDRVVAGLRAGAVAASGTAGALVGFGGRQGTPARPFNAIAALVLGARAEGIWGVDAAATSIGVLLHVALVLFLGVLFALLAAPLRGARLLVSAVLFSALVALAGCRALPASVHASVASAVTMPQVVVVYLVLSLCLVYGMRLAR